MFHYQLFFKKCVEIVKNRYMNNMHDMHIFNEIATVLLFRYNLEKVHEQLLKRGTVGNDVIEYFSFDALISLEPEEMLKRYEELHNKIYQKTVLQPLASTVSHIFRADPNLLVELLQHVKGFPYPYITTKNINLIELLLKECNLDKYVLDNEIKNMALSLLNIKEDDNVYDPNCVFGNLISSCTRYSKNFGACTNGNTFYYRTTLLNMIFATGSLPTNISNKHINEMDINNDFDAIVCHVPFSNTVTKISLLPNIPLSCTNYFKMYVQMIIRMLKIGGRASIICTDNSKSLECLNQYQTNIVKLLLKSCNVNQIIHFDEDVFIIYFEKVHCIDDILIIDKDTNGWRYYDFNENIEYATTEISMCKYNYDNNTIDNMCIPSVQTIKQYGWTLHYKSYANEMVTFPEEYQVLRLSDILNPKKEFEFDINKEYSFAGILNGKLVSSHGKLNKNDNVVQIHTNDLIICRDGYIFVTEEFNNFLLKRWMYKHVHSINFDVIDIEYFKGYFSIKVAPLLKNSDDPRIQHFLTIKIPIPYDITNIMQDYQRITQEKELLKKMLEETNNDIVEKDIYLNDCLFNF